MFKQRLTQLGGKGHGRLSRKELCRNGKYQTNHSQCQQTKTHFADIAHILSRDTLINDTGDYQRHKQLKASLKQLEQRRKYCFLFVLLEFICLLLLFRFNNYQSGIGFTSANNFVGAVYNVSAEISSFFNLDIINKQLVLRNIELEAENSMLREKLKSVSPDSIVDELHFTLNHQGYGTIPARVVNNTINMQDNYITLDKGTCDGIYPEMGVANGNGINSICVGSGTILIKFVLLTN